MKFAKIIELPENQVVLMAIWDEDNGYAVELHTEVGGMHVTTTVGFEDKEDVRDEMFESYSEETAIKFHGEMTKLLLED